MKLVAPTHVHKAFRADVLQLLGKHAGHLPAEEMLALATHLVGQIIAMQDQRTMTRQGALEIVSQNIEQGNGEAVAGLLETKGHS